MANIGTFTKAEDGTLSGFIKTLQLNTKAKFSPLDSTSNLYEDDEPAQFSMIWNRAQAK